jgi:hypothetical protein
MFPCVGCAAYFVNAKPQPCDRASAGPSGRGWVRAVDGVNSPGPWSSGQTVYALPVPILLGPSGTAPALPTFSWQPVIGASHYEIHVEDKTTGQVLSDGNVTGTTFIPSTALQTGDI